jgi:hypothetical protein
MRVRFMKKPEVENLVRLPLRIFKHKISKRNAVGNVEVETFNAL